MKGLVLLTTVALSVLIFTVAATAADEDAQQTALRLEAAKNQLNNTQWRIKLSPIGETKAKAYEDIIHFSEHKVSSENLASQGFSATNYTISVKDEDVIVWETMQTGEAAGLALWHGELENGVMRGVLSRRPNESTHLDFSFYSE